MSTKLIRQIKYAHAAELGAYLAYEGHSKAMNLNPGQKAYFHKIKMDELEHRKILEDLLKRFKTKPSKTLNLAFSIIGRVLGVLSRITGYYLPMKVAGFMEKLGTDGYVGMAKIALEKLDVGLYNVFMDMAEVESTHEEWFKRQT